MHVTILVDAPFVKRDRAMLARLQVGLADEGVRVVFAEPTPTSFTTPAAEAESLGVIAARATYEDRGMPWTLRARAQRLADAVTQTAPASQSRGRSIIHVFGVRAWGIAAETCEALGACLVVEISASEDVRRLRRSPWAALAPDRLLITCPEPGLARLVEREWPGVAVRIIPWGVPTLSEVRSVLPGDRSPAILIVASGRDRAACESAVQAFADAAGPEALLLLHSDAVRVGKLWPTLKRLGLSPRTTIIADLEGRRDLAILGADLLLLPEARGDYRSFTLDAMAAGLPVIAVADVAIDSTLGGQTARLISSSDARLIASALADALRHPEEARAVGAAAREHVRKHHRVSTHVAQILNAYEHMVGVSQPPPAE